MRSITNVHPTVTLAGGAGGTTGVAPASGAALVVLDRVHRRYATGGFSLTDVNLTVRRGELVRVEGPCGAGKTTLLRLIAALDLPSSGRVTIAGQDLQRLPPRARAHLRTTIGIVLHEVELPAQRTVLECTSAAALIAGATRAEAARRGTAALQRVGLDATLATARCCALSRSAARRVALARALVNRPALLVLDDPGAGLDATLGGQIQKLLEQFAAAGVTVLVSGAPGQAPGAAQAARVVRLAAGRLVGAEA